MEKRSRVITTRPLVATDAEIVVTMMSELAGFHNDQALASASDVVRFSSGRDQISKIFIAIMDGTPCGFSATYDWINYVRGFPVRNLHLFFIRAHARGNGVGRALFTEIAREAKSSYCQRITVGAQSDNEGANAFY